jgi:hypothetical protein
MTKIKPVWESCPATQIITVGTPLINYPITTKDFLFSIATVEQGIWLTTIRA